MTDIQEVLEIVKNIEANQGQPISWTVVGVVGVAVLALLWIFSKTYIESHAKKIFKKSLEKYRADLIAEIGKQFIEQKKDIDKEIENLKSDLQLITNQKNNFLNQKKEAIVEFYSNYINWLRTIENIDPLSLQLPKNIPLMADDYLRIMQEASTKCQISEGKLDLYNRNDDINALKNESVRLIKFLHETKSLAIVNIRDLWYKINHEGYIHKENEVHKIVNEYQKDRKFAKEHLYKITDDLRAKLSELISEISN